MGSTLQVLRLDILKVNNCDDNTFISTDLEWQTTY